MRTGWKVLIALIIIAIVFWVIFIIWEPVTSARPKLEVEENGEFSFSITQGCYAKINGVVRNVGSKYTDNARVQCTVYNENGEAVSSNEIILGQITPENSKRFNIEVNTDCTGQSKGASFDCSAYEFP